MRDISLHLLDLAQNSIKAEATLVEIDLTVDDTGLLAVTLKDNGHGMTEALAKSVQSPFVTSRTERRVGLGIPLFLENARLTGGDLTLTSQLGVGTEVKATFDTKHIDCLPLGDIAQTLYTLIVLNPETPDFLFTVKTGKGCAAFDTREVRRAVNHLPLNEPEIAAWIHEALSGELTPIL